MNGASTPADEAPVPMETESSNDTSTATSTTAGRSMSGTLRRKVAKRTFPWSPAAAEPLASPTPIDGDGDILVPVAKKPRLEEPLLETTEEAAKIASPDAEEAALPPADPDPMTAVSHPMNSDSEQTSRDDGSANKRSQKLSTTKPPSNASGRQGRVSAWEERLSELADYRKIHGHCNVPSRYSKNTKLGQWVGRQRINYRLQLEGKTSPMSPFRIHELGSLGFEWVGKQRTESNNSTWEERLSELADYRKIHGHCNVPHNYSENTKLAHWVAHQRSNYRLHVEGKTSPMTAFRIQALESLGFEWVGKQRTQSNNSAWEERLSELADYRKIHGHCNVPQKYSESTKLARWVSKQRKQYKLHLQGKTSPMSPYRIHELESLGFDLVGKQRTESNNSNWEDRLSELADYRKIHGHCNVPQKYSENAKLARWVSKQRNIYRLHQEGKTSSMTTFRIQELEKIGFEWGVCLAAWEERLNELADYRKIHGHCNVPHNYSENTKLAHWVANQRSNYRLHVKGKTPPMTTFRIQELESLGFEWGYCVTAWEDRLSELADYRKIHLHCNVPRNYSESAKLGQWVTTQRYQYRLHAEGKTSHITTLRIQELESLGFDWKPSSEGGKDMNAIEPRR
jgi:hypothetical protein